MINKTLILAIGNSLLSDEGAGIHALNLLRQQRPETPDVEYLDGGTLSFTLAAAIEEANHLIVLDAAQLDAPPGTVNLFVGEEMDRFLGRPRRSVHEVGITDLMDMVRLTERLPVKRALIGIQPQALGWGEVPTPAVAAGLPEMVRLAIALLDQWSIYC